MDESQFSLYRASGRQCVWHHAGKQFAHGNVVNRVPHSGGSMVWAGISYGQRTQVHFIDGNFNAQRYDDEIPWPIVMPFVRHHHLMWQHDYARPHIARICMQFLEDENISVLAYSGQKQKCCVYIFIQFNWRTQ